MLQRLLRYAQKVYGLDKIISQVSDSRRKPQISTSVIFGGALVMALARLGSLNALAQLRNSSFLKRWLGRELASADTNGRVFAQIDNDGIRAGLRSFYGRLKRNKALRTPWHGMPSLLIDGHESSTSYLRCCKGCLRRMIHTTTGDRTQYYHREVTAMLKVGKDRDILLDCERQRPGEDEVSAAMRLLKRVLLNYPRAFRVVVADGLYARTGFFNLVLAHSKDVIAVLKDERRDLLVDARGLFETMEPEVVNEGRKKLRWWDIEHFTSWTQLGREVRVVRSLETTTIRRQKDGREKQETKDWIWVTTLCKKKASTRAIVELGHGRWSIENQGFNELVNEWYADHVYKHDANAIEAFWLTMMLAYNLFHAFIRLNLKPVIRKKHTLRHWARILLADLFRQSSCSPVPP